MREIRRGVDRYLTRGDGVSTRHSFSYGAHYDPDNVAFGPIIAINTERVDPGRGYDAHHHADVEIVTWVTAGVLRHRDSTGAGGDIEPGVAQRLSAGSGVEHTELNASDSEALEFVQMMLASEHDGEPAYEQRVVDLRAGELAPTVPVRAAAELFVATLAGEPIEVPEAPRRLIHVTRGDVAVDGESLRPGDELRVDDGAPLVLTGTGEALVWLLHR